jgi:hypothetical protein
VTKAWHLAARFATSLPPTPPSVDDEVWVDEHLLAGERSLWVQLSNQDRRHSAAVARRFVHVRPDATRAEIAGAILHDVGKIECGLGTFGRVVATLVGPRTRAFAAYHDHEAIGAGHGTARRLRSRDGRSHRPARPGIRRVERLRPRLTRDRPRPEMS